MSACKNQKSTIMLDIYGELDAEERMRLQQHLEICEGCRKERQQMVGLMGKIKTTMKSPELSFTEAKRMANTILWRLNNARSPKWWSQIFATRPSRLIPALAAASILIVMAGIIGYNTFIADNKFRYSANVATEQLNSQDLEIINNLDLLRDMDAIQKLVQAVDQSPTNLPTDKTFDDTQGMKNGIYGGDYA